jgi:hypothetical protein
MAVDAVFDLPSIPWGHAGTVVVRSATTGWIGPYEGEVVAPCGFESENYFVRQSLMLILEQFSSSVCTDLRAMLSSCVYLISYFIFFSHIFFTLYHMHDVK